MITDDDDYIGSKYESTNPAWKWMMNVWRGIREMKMVYKTVHVTVRVIPDDLRPIEIKRKRK